ncbi:hypothetical protein BG005_005945 [Podila minutissima]|nr:hypothetical protein BG005_005945 [Podila minutissima]
MDMSCLPTLITSSATSTPMASTSLTQLSPEFEYLTPSSMLPYQSDGWSYSMSIDAYNNSSNVATNSQSTTDDYEDHARNSSFAEGIILQSMDSGPDPNLLSALQFSYQDRSFEASPSPSPSPACLTPGQTISSSEFVVMMNEAASRLKAMAAETSPVTRTVDNPYGLARLPISQHGNNKANNKKQKPRYLCHIPNCGRTFSRPFNLKSHGLTHEPQRPHACDQCPKTFARIHDRDRHMKGHLTEKAHCCIVCLGRFARQDAVTRHLKLSNEMNPCSLILKANGITFRDAAAGRVGRHQLGEEADIRRTLDMLDEQARKTKASRAMELMSD